MEEMMTVKEVSHVLHVHHNTVRKWCEVGKIKHYRLNLRGDIRFKRCDVEAFIRSCDHNGGKM